MPDEPRTRGTIFVGFRGAVIDKWGDAALATLGAAMPDDARRETLDTILDTLAWYPSRHLLAWHRAVLEGPARSNEAEYRAFVDRALDLGFWRVQRLLLKVATPMLLVERSARLWRHNHTHGELVVRADGERCARVTLRDHPLTTTPLSRMSIAEALRYIVSLARARNVRETHALGGSDPNELAIRITWD